MCLGVPYEQECHSQTEQHVQRLRFDELPECHPSLSIDNFCHQIKTFCLQVIFADVQMFYLYLCFVVDVESLRAIAETFHAAKKLNDENMLITDTKLDRYEIFSFSVRSVIKDSISGLLYV